MRIAIEHRLRIEVPEFTGNAVMQLLMSPQSGPTQTVELWDVDAPGIGSAAKFADAFGNTMYLTNQLKPEGMIEIVAKGVVSTTDTHGVLGKPAGEPVPALYLRSTPQTRVPVTLYGKFRNIRGETIATLHALMSRVHETHGERAETQSQAQSQGSGGQSQSQSQSSSEEARAPADAVQLAHAFIGAARALEIPARFVSGYLLGEDDTPHWHGWAEAYDTRLGWIGFDPSLDVCPTTRHVRMAVGLDSQWAQPVRCVPAGNGFATVALSVAAA